MDTDIVGMAIRGGTIYYCAWEEGLKKLSLSDNSVSDIINADSISTVTGQYNSTIWKKRASSDTSTLDVYLLLQIQLYIVN
jgi:hypothetical protein